jgi:hypothetical protein
MKREDFINGILFEYNGRIFQFETESAADPKAATGCYPRNSMNRYGEFVHMKFTEKGVSFWACLSGIWLDSKTIVPYSSFKLISTPEREPSVQGA